MVSMLIFKHLEGELKELKAPCRLEEFGIFQAILHLQILIWSQRQPNEALALNELVVCRR